MSKINCAAAHWSFFIFFSRSLSLLINSKCLQKKKPACGLLCRVGTDECKTEIRLLIGGVVLWLFFFLSPLSESCCKYYSSIKKKSFKGLNNIWDILEVANRNEKKKKNMSMIKRFTGSPFGGKWNPRVVRQCHRAVRHVVTERLWFKRTHIFAGLLCCHCCRC